MPNYYNPVKNISVKIIYVILGYQKASKKLIKKFHVYINEVGDKSIQ